MDIYLTSLPLQLTAVILIILTAVLSYFRPRFIALLVPIILPFYLVKIYFRPGSHNLVIPTNLMEILLFLFLIINFPLVIRGFKLVLGKYLGKYFVFSVLLFLLAVVISTIYAINLRGALGAAKSWFFLPVGLFFVLLPLLKNSRFRQKFLYSIAFSGIIVTLVGAVFLLENVFTYDGRLTGPYLSPNHLAMALVPGILALFSLIISPSNSRNKAIFYVLMLFELIALYFTYSYGAWLALLAAASLTIIQVNRQNIFTKKLLPYYLITALFLVIIGLSQLSNPKLQHILNGDYYSSLHSRLMIWNSALLISRDHLFTGIGADNFQQAYLDCQKRFTEPYIEWSAPQPHNIFLALQTQLGILGIISFLSLLIFTFLRLRGNSIDPLKFFSISYLSYIIFHGLVDTPYFKNDLALIFWISLAIIWTEKNSLKKNSKNSIAKF